jgi:hypothetical protein
MTCGDPVAMRAALKRFLMVRPIPKTSVFHRVIGHYNYFTHHDKFRSLQWKAAWHFTEDFLLRETPVHLDQRFDNTTERSFCTMEYHLWKLP